MLNNEINTKTMEAPAR